MRNKCAAIACCLVLALGGGLAGVVDAAPQASAASAAIPPMPLKEALNAFAQREHLQFVYVSQIAAGVRTQGAPAGLSQRATLQALLGGTGLQFRFLNSNTVTIYPEGEPLPSKASATKPSSPPTAKHEQEPVQLEQVTVTGSRIRGAPPASPVIVISQDQMIQSGQTDLGEVIRSIPQNFSGGQNPGVTLGSGGIGNQNITGGSAVNLRGLGGDASLTLLNGRRLSFDGFGQAVDISQIPLGAVDRVETLTDGASAIYGSDAVAGVVNVILQPDYSGLSGTVRFGEATSGGDFQRQYSLVGGTRWSTGGFIATANYEKDSAIEGQQRSYTKQLAEPHDILGNRKVKSSLFSIHQRLGPRAKFKMDALYTKRNSSKTVNEGFQTLGLQLDATQYLVSPELTFQLPAMWLASINGVYGRDKGIVTQPIHRPDGSLQSASSTCYCNRITAWEVDADGPLFHLPGGAAQLAVGGGYRRISFTQRSLSNPARAPASSHQHDYYAFAQLYLPAISPSQKLALVDHLSFSAAVRREQYSSFGGVTTPKIGIIYGPTIDFDVKASWGKSFKAPTLLQQNQSFIAYLEDAAAQLGGVGYPPTATALITYGGNPNLKPERATTWTLTLDLHPQALPGLRTQLTYFRIAYDKRVSQVIAFWPTALVNPAYKEFVNFSPTLAEIQAIVGKAGSGFRNYSSAPYDPNNVVAILNDQYVNVTSQNLHGVDVLASYEFDWGGNSLTFNGNASWLTSDQRNTPLSPAIDLAGTIYNQPHWRSRVGATWERGSLILSAYYNYIGPVTDTISQTNVEGKSMQTIDITGIYHFASNIDLSASILNALNKPPPYLKSRFPSIYVPYDSTNYSPVGRFVQVSVTKKW